MHKILLAVILIIQILLTGCENNLNVKKAEEKVQISIALWNLEAAMNTEDASLKKLEDKLGIKINPVNISGNDYTQKIQIWSSTGQLPDVFADNLIGTRYYRKWIEEGVVKALSENLGAYPNLEKYLSTAEFQNIKEDGKFYCIPRKSYENTDYNILERVVAYRWDLAQKAGIKKEPETWQEFKTMLNAIIKADPENKGISGLTSVSNILIGGLFWLYSSPAATSDGGGHDFKWIHEDGKYIPAVFSKNSVESLKIARDFFSSGLIDKDLPYTKGDMAFDKFAQGKAAAIISPGGIASIDRFIYKYRWLKLHPEEKAFYDKVKILKPLKSMDGKRYHAIFRTFWSESYISSGVNDDKMYKILQMFDYMNTSEFIDMRQFGIKDIDYKKSGDKIIRLNPGEDIQAKYKGLYALSTLLQWDDMFQLDHKYTSLTEDAYKVQQEFIESSLNMTSKQDYNLRLTYLSTPTKDGFTIYDNEDMIKVMLSNESVEIAWQKILDGYKAKGLEKMIEEVNKYEENSNSN